MKILGICNANNSGAALIVDGRIVAVANEERFTREKVTRDFPNNAINYVLRAGDIALNDIDHVGCGAWAGIDSIETLPTLIHEFSKKVIENSSVRDRAFDRFNATINSDAIARKALIDGCRNFGIDPSKVVFCDHHRSHALVAFYPSEFEEAAVLVADGRGDFRSISIWDASRKRGLQCIHTISEMNSLGAMYGYITKLLGFVPDRHEGKVTGLAARGKPSVVYDALRSAIYFKEETGEIETRYGEYYLPYMGANLESLEKLMAKVPKEDFAFAAQAVLEEVLCKYLKFYLARHHEGKAVNLCLSGGCSANVKLNFELSKLEQVDSLYVSPEMGDGGNALGGALNCMVKSSTSNYPQMPTVYLGPNYSDVEIIQACKKNNVSATQVSNEKKIAYLAKELANGKIIGWFMGRMEYGPRALGARSILASPLDASINISLNKRLNRTEFMPFAPATTEDLAEACFLQWKASDVAARFMTTCYECTDLMQAKCPATVHIDNTARPQVVRRPDNPQYYDLIAKFHEISGAPAIINTSFNHHEEPIVCSPDDAIRSYLNGNVDLLVIEDFLITETV